MQKDKNNQNVSKEKLLAEIERLKKELKKRKKYGLVWEEKPEDVVEMCKKKLPVLKEVKNKEIITNKDKPTNLLIEGDNYHALSVLNYTHAGKVDVIYIDPPYNTGARDWKYNNDYVDINDAWRHSKWLSMMAHRLQIARSLLKKDGVFICAIDENEFYRLGLLLEDIFKGFEIHCIAIVHNPRGVQGNNFSYTHEYAYFVFRKGLKVIGTKQRDEVLEEELRDHGGESLRTNARNCFYPILAKNNQIIGFGEVPDKDFHPQGKNVKRKDGIIEVWPIDRNGIERKWVFALNTINKIRDKLFVKEKNGGEIDIFRIKDVQKPRTVWTGPKYDASTFGSKIVNGLTGTQFPFPKSIYNTKDCLECVVKERENAIILDFFAGSGTTAHAVMLLNKEYGGERKFILCTNNENGIAEEVCLPRIKKVIEGHKDYPDITGIPANLKYFKTDFVDYDEPTDKNKIKLTKQATEMLCVKEGTFEKVLDKEDFKIFKNSNHYTGIIWDQATIPAFKKAIEDIKGKFSVYVFSLGDETFDDEFKDIKQKVQLSPIPEAILRVYRRIFR
jgi:adenine-specific DNA-methyltransferase